MDGFIKIAVFGIIIALLIHFALEEMIPSKVLSEPQSPALAKMDQDLRSGLVTAPYIGNPQGQNIVVAFFDYNCGYCKEIDKQVLSLADWNSSVKVVFIEYPILGSSSTSAAKMALAVFNLYPDKYAEFHHRVMNSSMKSQDQLMAIAKDMGIIDDLVMESNKPIYGQIIEANKALAASVGIYGTPQFVVNGYIARFSDVKDYYY